MAEEATTVEAASVEQTETQEASVEKQETNSESIDKIVQSKVDRLMAEERKKTVELEKQLKTLQKEKLSTEELKRVEVEEREKTLAEKEKALADRENRLYAIKAIQAAGLNDGSDEALDLIDFVISDDEETMNKKVNTFKALVDKMVAAKVGQKFKENGRLPNGAGAQASANTDNIAARLGQAKAEQAKKSNDILNYYLGGKK